MSSRPGLGRCRVVRVRDDVESSRPESMLSRSGSGRFCVVWARADVDSFETESMSSGSGLGRRVVRPGSMSNRVGLRRSTSKLSQIRPNSSQVSLCLYQNGFNIFDKVDLI